MAGGISKQFAVFEFLKYSTDLEGSKTFRKIFRFVSLIYKIYFW